MRKIIDIQRILGVEADGFWGPKTQAALEALLSKSSAVVHRVKASSFADPADIAAFRRCKDAGKTDAQCFAVGDNGFGAWWEIPHPGTLEKLKCATLTEAMDKWFEGFNIPVLVVDGVREDFSKACDRVKRYYAAPNVPGSGDGEQKISK